MADTPSYVVTGAAGGVGRAIATHLAEHGHVIALDLTDQLPWQHDRVHLHSGDAGDADVVARAARRAEALGPMTGWVNNAAVFVDASLDTAPVEQVMAAITANLAMAVTGCAAAVRHYLAHQRGGAIVNVSSHQAQRPVRGALPYATAKAAVEGLTRAVAVDHGPQGIRTNAVPSARSPPSATRPTAPGTPASTRRWPPCTRWDGWAPPPRSLPRSPSCSHPQRASSTAPSCPSTVAAPPTDPTLKPSEPATRATWAHEQAGRPASGTESARCSDTPATASRTGVERGGRRPRARPRVEERLAEPAADAPRDPTWRPDSTVDRNLVADLAHADHPIASPLDDDTVDRLLRTALAGQRSVLDLGCGDGTWLLRALRTSADLRAVGVDLSGAGFGRTRDTAASEGTGDRLELHAADAREWTIDERFDVVLSIGATHAFGGLVPTIEVAASHLQPGGRLLVGECFWEQPPSARALGALGAAADDYRDLAGTVAAVRRAGWEPLTGHVSSLQEWDAYEWSWTGSLTRWALEHPDDPSSEEVLAVAEQHREAWLGGYRGTLGFVTLLLAQRPGS